MGVEEGKLKKHCLLKDIPFAIYKATQLSDIYFQQRIMWSELCRQSSVLFNPTMGFSYIIFNLLPPDRLHDYFFNVPGLINDFFCSRLRHIFSILLPILIPLFLSHVKPKMSNVWIPRRNKAGSLCFATNI